MKATFENTVDILVKAYLNDTLEHGNCYACAVGNIVAANNGYTYAPCWDRTSKRFALKENDEGSYFNGSLGAKWYEAVDECFITPADQLSSATIKEIDSTGYSVEEVNRIEKAFENCNRGLSDDEYMFNGLMAVVDVLADIHGISLEAKEKSKLLFVKL